MTGEGLTEGLNRIFRDPITNILLKNSNLTDIQFETFVIDVLTEVISDEKIQYKKKSLLRNKKEIEQKLDYNLEWMELEGKKASRIKASLEINVTDRNKWAECFKWLDGAAQAFQRVFLYQLKRIKI